MIIQNNVSNKYSPIIIVASITSQINKAKIPTHMEISAKNYGIDKDLVVLFEHIVTINKRRLEEKIGEVPKSLFHVIDKALCITFDIKEQSKEDYILYIQQIL